jgi:cytochrome d ubiquinol oxidase subunit I
VGAVSGTVLSVEFGLLWPSFMERYGAAFGVSFTLEAFAFFLEAIFLGLYLYGWDRLKPWVHWWCGVPVALGGACSALFVTTANAWMNTPVGIVEQRGKVIVAEPFAPFAAPTTWPQVVHLLLAAGMCTGFAVAAVYAVGILRGRRDAYHRRGFAVGGTAALVLAPIQIVVGDWAARAVAANQPVKFAAMEGLGRTRDGAPLSLGGIWDARVGELRGAIEIPRALSLMMKADPGAKITGLDVVPAGDRPPVTVTHLAFGLMVGIGFAFLILAGWALWRWWRARRTGVPVSASRWFLRAVVASGPAAMVALVAGWVVTEVGRQPWIVYRLMRTNEAVSTQPGLEVFLYVTAAVYLVLGITLVGLLRRMATGGPISTKTGTTPDLVGANTGQVKSLMEDST